MLDIFSKHQNIALQLSGGRDSIACVYLLRDYLDRVTVYWTNTGNAFPETIETINHLKPLIPNFVEISGNQPEVIRQFGLPSDLVPVANTPMGVYGGQSDFLIQDRYSCCTRSILNPMHERMIADGITLIIRGQRNSDRLKARYRSGDIVDGFQFYFPIEDWSESDVMAYLEKEGAPIPRFYSTLSSTPDCIGCTAWWEEGRAAYLKEHHPQQYAQYRASLSVLKKAIKPSISMFNVEIAP